MKPRFQLQRRSGLTLIEMLISVALTLLVVLAIVRVFDMLGGTVSETRTILELSAQLRQVSNRLQHDLDRITAPPVPPADPGNAPGFFEFMEGPDRDKFPNWGNLHDLQAFNGEHLQKKNDGTIFEYSLSNNVGTYSKSETSAINDTGWYGDLDDVLMFTIQSDGEPFRGRVIIRVVDIDGKIKPVQIPVESKYAMVVWWVERSFDLDGAPKSFRLHRRQLLIWDDPGVDADTSETTKIDELRNYLRTFNIHGANTAFEINRFYNTSDVAVRLPTPAEQKHADTNRLMLCTLEQLTDRDYRYGHLVSPTNPPSAFPFPFLLPRFVEQRCQTNKPGFYDTQSFWHYYSAHAKKQPFNLSTVSGIEFNGTQIDMNAWNIDFSAEDVVLGDVLAFDVRVYDPQAPLRYEPDNTVPANVQTGYNNSHQSVRPYILTPTDRGYIVPGPSDSSTINQQRLMRGAFVDLFYAYRDARYQADSFLTGLDSEFAFPPNLRSQLTPARMLQLDTLVGQKTFEYMVDTVVYDSWSKSYNRDGIDQNGNGAADEGNNGLDDDLNGIVDDINEREVVPPYSTPIRGIEVIIRALEISSQQIRQVSVVSNFKGD